MNVPVLEGRGLSKHYPVRLGPFRRGLVQAVNDVDFELHGGQTLAIVGESGSGKSSLARQLVQIETPTAGRVLHEGRDVTHADRGTRRLVQRKVRMVFQDPYGSLNPRARVGTLLEEPLINHTSLGPEERRARVREMLQKVGLGVGCEGRYPHMFSGGQRQRIAIARALVLRPQVVVADEPVSALDVSIQAQVLNLLMDLRREFGLAFILIAHDISIVRHMADTVLVLYLGRVMESGLAGRVLDDPMHPYTQALLTSTPQIDPARRRERQVLRGELPSPLQPPFGCAFHTRCPYATEVCRNERPRLRQIGGRRVACHHAGELNLSG